MSILDAYPFLQNPSISIRDLYQCVSSVLKDQHISTAQLDARLLLCHIYDMADVDFITQKERMVDPSIFIGSLKKRLDGVPVSKIIGVKEFFGRDFITNNDVLDPRPDSELLIQTVLDHYRDKPSPETLLDCGTGSGCLIVTLLKEFPQARGVAIDISPAALAVATKNAIKHGVDDRLMLKCYSFEDVEAGVLKQSFACIISNPPYIPSADIAGLEPDVKHHDPMMALDGGLDGFAPYHILFSTVKRFLEPNGFFIFECGIDQASILSNRAADSGLDIQGVNRDIQGIERVFYGTI